MLNRLSVKAGPIGNVARPRRQGGGRSRHREATQRNSALVEENAATAKTLEQQSHRMRERISFFRLGGDAAPAHRASAAAA